MAEHIRKLCIRKPYFYIFIFILLIFTGIFYLSNKLNLTSLSTSSKAAKPKTAAITKPKTAAMRLTGGLNNPCFSNPPFCNSNVSPQLFCDASLDFWVSYYLAEEQNNVPKLDWSQTTCRYKKDIIGQDTRLCRSSDDPNYAINGPCNPGLSCFVDASTESIDNYFKTKVGNITLDTPQEAAINTYKSGEISNYGDPIVNICLPESLSAVEDCGDQGQDPCPGDVCYSPNKLTVEHKCDSCGALGQIPCREHDWTFCTDPFTEVSEDIPICKHRGGLGEEPWYDSENGINKCSDPQLFIWGDKNKGSFGLDCGSDTIVSSENPQLCQPMPSSQDFLDYDQLGKGFEATGKRSIRLAVYTYLELPEGFKSISNIDYNNFGLVSDRRYKIYIDVNSTKLTKEKTQNLLFNNIDKDKLNKIFWSLELKFDEISDKLDFSTTNGKYSINDSYLTASCNGHEIKLPVYDVDKQCMASIYASFVPDHDFYHYTSSQDDVIRNNYYEMGAQAWNQCQFRFDKDNEIIFKQLHLTFTNDYNYQVVYNYDFSKAKNNYVDIVFIYNHQTPAFLKLKQR